MLASRLDPEDEARIKIDQMLENSGWTVQHYKDIDLGASRGIAVAYFPLGGDEADYALFIDKNPVGVVEAKKVGHTLSGVTEQSEKYLKGLHEKYPKGLIKPPYSYETTGVETIFADRRDPNFRSREVFTFHRPEILAEWLKESQTLRAKLKQIPKLDDEGLWDCQIEAIQELEKSFADNKPRALVQMATGSGKTFAAVTSVYRLIKHCKAKRILFLVDRGNLGRQANREFQNYTIPHDGRKFHKVYNVQHLTSNTIDPVNKVVITTIQRMYSILKGEREYEAENEEKSSFEQPEDQTPVEVKYNPNVPIEEFDFIIIDECHRSIYNKWQQVLDYFDAFLIGLTATPSKHTIGFFNNNQVMSYTHARAVADGVNVDYTVYRIKTRITEHGDHIEAGEYIEKRDKLTREKRSELMEEEIAYEKPELDQSVVAPDQIRLIIRTFRDKLPEMFPGRQMVPKTLVFAKDDSHAEDIVKIIKEEFGKGNEFCKKITYRTTGEKPEDLISSFRNSTNPRIAVSVDMIAAGTDIKPLECILFLRDVKSKLYFDQMKGRGTRIISTDDLQGVTSDAKIKDHFVIVDAVGVCEHAMSDTHSLTRKKGVSFEQLMQTIAEGRADEDTLETFAGRLATLDKKLDDKAKKEIEEVSEGKSLTNLINRLLDGIDTDKQIERAKEKFKTEKPTQEQLEETIKESIDFACEPFKPRLRDTILEVKKRNEQIIDIGAIDSLISAEFDEKAKEQSKKVVENFKDFIEKNKDEILALQIIYSKPYKMREITYNDIKKIAEAIENPPYNLTPELIWHAYERLDKSKVKGSPQKILTDIIALIRFSIGKSDFLMPFSEIVNEKFEKWLENQQSSGKKFTSEQKEWLVMIKDHIAASASITIDDMDLSPFTQKGGRVKLYQIFGDDYEKILQELHETLISV